MQDENTEVLEPTEVSIEETETPEVEETEATEDPAQETPEVAEPEVPAYTPNFAYKAGGVEHQIPEMFHDLINSEERENEIRDIMERAQGIDAVKEARDSVKTEFSQYREQVDPVIDNLANAASYLEKGDIVGFAKQWNVTPDQLVKAAYEYTQMSPEQQQAQDQIRQASERERTLEAQLQEQTNLNQQIQVQHFQGELNVALQSPEAAAFAQTWNAAGKPHSFEQEVIQQANIHQMMTGEVLRPQAAVQMTLAKYNLGQPATPAAQAPVPTTPPVQETPVIPAAPSSGGSPIKQQPSSTDALRAYGKTLRDPV